MKHRLRLTALLALLIAAAAPVGSTVPGQAVPAPASARAAAPEPAAAKDAQPAPKQDTPAQPRRQVIASATLRKRMLALVDSLKTHADTDAPNVQRVMGLRLRPAADWKFDQVHLGRVSAGWNYWISVISDADLYNVPRAGSGSTVEMMFFPGGETDVLRKRTSVCSFDAAAFEKALLARGYTRGKWPAGPERSENWGYQKPDPKRRFVFVIDMSIYRINRSEESQGTPCLRAFTIRQGEL